LPVPPDGVDSAALYDEPFRLAVPAQHELARRSGADRDLNGETVLLLSRGRSLPA
jgi:DNA-binding transcriptional LysR family regulator